MPSELTISPEFLQALELMEESSQHVFITGKAGTGKSTLLNHFRTTTKKTVAVLAPTGVAALNVQGQTIHSFFKFRPDTNPESVGRQRITVDQAKIYRELDALVIDEVSMLRADLLDCIDLFLRKHGPKRGVFFGGIQMIFFGDLYQLPPVVTSYERALFQNYYKGPHFFHAKVMDQIGLYSQELSTIYRQQEAEFIDILNAIRTNTATPEHLQVLNASCGRLGQEADGTITLTTTNDLADMVNRQQLAALPGNAFEWKGATTGTFNERDFPTPADLQLKTGAQVMMLTNDPRGRWVNGSIGHVISVYDEPESNAPTVEVLLHGGKKIRVEPFTWELYKYGLNEEAGVVEPQVSGTYKQYPLRLAWAVTIHKSQGKTFDKVIIDLGRGTFSPGQLYVALSRCRTLEGICLKQPVERRHIMSDGKIVDFLNSFQHGYRKVGQDSLFNDDFGSEWSD